MKDKTLLWVVISCLGANVLTAALTASLAFQLGTRAGNDPATQAFVQAYQQQEADRLNRQFAEITRALSE